MHNHFEKKTLKALLKKIYKDNHDINPLTQEITDIILNFKNNNKTSRKKNNTYLTLTCLLFILIESLSSNLIANY